MRNLFVIVILMVVSLSAQCKKIPGTIIAKGEARNVTFDIKVDIFFGEPNFERLQYKIKYFDEAGKKKTLRPDDADEVIFDYQGLEVRMISCLNTMGGGDIFSASNKIFLKLEIDGPLRLYRFYYKQTSPGMYSGVPGSTYTPGTSYTVDNFIFQKRGGTLKRSKGLGWRKDMREYFKDCPELVELIESKDLGKKEVEAIVTFYNRKCG